jgi:inorganic triphosphatase YgiF
MTDTLERELKLVPASEALLDQLAGIDRLGPFEVRGHHREAQLNSFFDSRSGGLRQARVGFRRRTIEGDRLATWSIKGDARHVGAVATRAEIELRLDADMPPALALSALRDAARTRGASALSEAVSDALASGGLPLAQPVLETRTDRRIVDLSESEHHWDIELALDRMELLGHAYHEVEIEAELKRGDLAALDAIHTAIATLGMVSESHDSKLSRALAHLDGCECR